MRSLQTSAFAWRTLDVVNWTSYQSILCKLPELRICMLESQQFAKEAQSFDII